MRKKFFRSFVFSFIAFVFLSTAVFSYTSDELNLAAKSFSASKVDQHDTASFTNLLELFNDYLFFENLKTKIDDLKERYDSAERMLDIGHGDYDEVLKYSEQIKKSEPQFIKLQEKLGLIFLESVRFKESSKSEKIAVRFKEYSPNDISINEVIALLFDEIKRKREENPKVVINIRIDGEPGAGKSRLSNIIKTSLEETGEVGKIKYIETDAHNGKIPSEAKNLDPEEYSTLIVDGAFSSDNVIKYDHVILTRVDEVTSLKRVLVRNRDDKLQRFQEKKDGYFKSLVDDLENNFPELIIVNTFTERDLFMNQVLEFLPTSLIEDPFIDVIYEIFKNVNDYNDFEIEIEKGILKFSENKDLIKNIADRMILIKKTLKELQTELEKGQLSKEIRRQKLQIVNILLKDGVTLKNKIKILEKTGIDNKDIQILNKLSVFADYSILGDLTQKVFNETKLSDDELLVKIKNYFNTEEVQKIMPLINEVFLLEHSNEYQELLSSFLLPLVSEFSALKNNKSVFEKTNSFLEQLKAQTQIGIAA